MRIALIVVSVVVAFCLVSGVILRHYNPLFDSIYRFGWLAFAFGWVPFFLFYRFDKRQQAKQKQEEQG